MKFVADITDTTDVVTKEYVDGTNIANFPTYLVGTLKDTNYIGPMLSIWQERYYQIFDDVFKPLTTQYAFRKKITKMLINQ